MVTSARDKAVKQKGWCMTNEAGIHVHWLPILYSNKMSYKKRIKAFLKFSFFASLKAASLKGDLIYATSTPLTIAIPAVYASKINKIPMVFEVRDLWPELPIAVGALKNSILIWGAKKLEKFAYNNSERIITLSPGMKNGIIKTGYLESKVIVIPNSCDLRLFSVSKDKCNEFRKKYVWLKERPLILYCGTMGLINGVDYFVLLADEVYKIDPEVRFLVVGKGREEKKIRALAKKRGILNKNFFIFSPVSKKNVPVIIKSANVATSLCIDLKELWDNSANKFFDALAAGTPFAINYKGWQADILIKSEAGIVLDVKDIPKAARDLLKVLDNKEWMQLARKKARELAEKKFSRDILAKQLEGVLLNAVAKHRK
jgi:glycosyltransferase involved in cell wall biosynthesis